MKKLAVTLLLLAALLGGAALWQHRRASHPGAAVLTVSCAAGLQKPKPPAADPVAAKPETAKPETVTIGATQPTPATGQNGYSPAAIAAAVLLVLGSALALRTLRKQIGRAHV